MTQEKINEMFNTSLGIQISPGPLYSCSDDKVLIRYEEALKHVNGELDPDTKPLEDKTVLEWYDTNGEPNDQQCYNSLTEVIDTLIKDHSDWQEEHSTGWDLLQTLYFIRSNYPNDPISNKTEDLPF